MVTQVVPIAVLLVNILSSFKKSFISTIVHFYLKWRFFAIVMMDTHKDMFRLHQGLKHKPNIDKGNGSYSAAATNKERTKLVRETGCKEPYSLRRLPHHDRYLNTPVEPMHTLKNVAERIVHTLSGMKDSLKVRREEEERGRFQKYLGNNWK